MITNITGNFNSNIGEEGIFNTYINKAYPRLTSMESRLKDLFLKNCKYEVNNYSKCIDNNYSDNINQYLPLEKRLECNSAWSVMKSCAKKYVGDGFALKLEVSRSLDTSKLINHETINEENIKKYNKFMATQLKYLKEDMPVEGEEEEEEAAAEGEAEGEVEESE